MSEDLFDCIYGNEECNPDGDVEDMCEEHRIEYYESRAEGMRETYDL